jgi:hypothetical protein
MIFLMRCHTGWNGRGWPFQNSVVYKAYAKYLRDYKATRSAISEEDRQLLYDHVTQYVRTSWAAAAVLVSGIYPVPGGYRMPGGGDVVQSLPAMGKGFGDVQDYFHSTFPDVLIEDLIGFQGSHGDSFEIHPLPTKKTMEILLPGGPSISWPRRRYPLERRLVFNDSRHAKQAVCMG